MIQLTKLNHERFVLNCDHIITIDCIPDSKITLINKEFFIVQESMEEIVEKIIEYKRKIGDKTNTDN